VDPVAVLPAREVIAMPRDDRSGAQLRCAAAALLLLLSFSPAHAAQWVESTNSTIAEVFSDGAGHPIELGGATSFSVFTYAPATLAIRFTAECSVQGTDNITWLDLDIVVDGVVAAPTNNDNAFCTDHGNGVLQNWVSAAADVVVPVAAGLHTIEVRGFLQVFDAGDQWRIDDKSLIVIVQQ
jgi:hypothetical protein